MQLISLQEFKDHARILHDDEDTEVSLKVEAASDYVSSFLDVDEDEYTPPADVKQATLMIAAHWYERRENSFDGSLHNIPLDASEILINHRGWAF